MRSGRAPDGDYYTDSILRSHMGVGDGEQAEVRLWKILYAKYLNIIVKIEGAMGGSRAQGCHVSPTVKNRNAKVEAFA